MLTIFGKLKIREMKIDTYKIDFFSDLVGYILEIAMFLIHEIKLIVISHLQCIANFILIFL